MDDNTMKDLVKKYAPVLYFHPNEAYFPASADTYLQNCTLLDSNSSGTASNKAVDVNTLPSASATAYLQLFGKNADSVRKGDLGQARAYVNVIGTGISGQYDIQYWFFYAFNGPTTMRFDGLVGGSTDNEAPPLGQHDGDWEHIVVRVDTNDNILAVYFSQHSTGTWYSPASQPGATDGFHLENATQVQVYVAQNTHACYPNPGNYGVPGSEKSYGVFSFSLRDDATPSQQNPKKWDTAKAYQIININAPDLNEVDNPPEWVEYTGQWGPDVSQSLSVTEAATVIGQAIVAVPWLVALLAAATVGGTAALVVIATVVVANLNKDEEGTASPPWNPDVPNLSGQIVISNWNCLQHKQNMVLSCDQSGKAILTTCPVELTSSLAPQRWTCLPNTAPDAPKGSFTLLNVSTGKALTMPNDGQQIAVGTSPNPTQDKAFAWVFWPANETGETPLWVLRGALGGNVMDAYHQGCGENTQVIYHSWNKGDNQRWVINSVG